MSSLDPPARPPTLPPPPRRPRPGRRPLLAAFLLAASIGSGRAQLAAQEVPREEILDYDVAIQVEADGWMEVTEEIRVRALGREIRRGIYRDFPTSFPRTGGFGRIEAPFEVVRVLRDGAPEPWIIQSVGGPSGRGGIRVRIGDPDVLLERGEHTYAITYRTIRWIRFGESADELYWNVTGNGWDFPILSASAEVSLPEPVDPDAVTLEGWTGPEGSTDSRLTSSFDPDVGPAGAWLFRTTDLLGPREGLTIRLAFPKGVVAPPTEAQAAEWFRMDWGRWVEAGTVVALVLCVYLLLWLRVGRDPAEGPVMVRYEPPAGFTPAGLGYVVERGHANRHLTAAVVDLAVRGWLEIDRDGSKWTLRRTDETPDEPAPHEEDLLLRGLFGGVAKGDTGHAGEEVTLEGSHMPEVRSAVNAFRADMGRRLEADYFRLNRGWFAAGLLVTVLGFAVLAWRARFSIAPHGWFLGIWLTFWTMGTGTLVWRVLAAWRMALSGRLTYFVGAAGLSLFATPFVVAWVVVAFILWQAVPGHLLAAAVGLGGLNVLFYHLLERPTLRGRGVLDQAEGLRRFLTSTEEDRIRRLQPVDAPLELFERYLPWAIALGVESEWAERFEEVLAAQPASSAAGGRIGPSWYGGGSDGSLSGMSSSLGSSFSSSLSASSAAPASSGGSSGGGGGGSSGGGGGGGGGGGW
ncbi:MAG TPA: DUF2207 domain-containing protein [Longimicrobiales bacterium]|nr:DUF2207 domain-containing protein [Longimicrobiales bacterium]